MKKQFFLFLLLLFVAGLFVGCKQNKEDVVLASTSQIKSYAKGKYGKAEYLDTTEEDFCRTCTFKDKQYGFEYYVSSYVQAVGIDASIAGYTEGKASDFPQQYCTALSPPAIEKCNYELDGVHAFNTNSVLCTVVNVEPEDAADVTQEVAKLIGSLDSRGFFADGEIRAYAGDKEQYLGAFYVKERKYLSYADYMAGQMQVYAESDVNRPGSEKKEIEYLYYEQMPLSEVPGIDEYELVKDNLSEDSIVTVFYFKIGGKKYFYCDVKVWMDHSDRYYSSYRFGY